jgi:hypothetical protein
VYIQHKRNGGEKTVGQYSLDGYDEETRIQRMNSMAVSGTVSFLDGQFFYTGTVL